MDKDNRKEFEAMLNSVLEGLENLLNPKQVIGVLHYSGKPFIIQGKDFDKISKMYKNGMIN